MTPMQAACAAACAEFNDIGAEEDHACSPPGQCPRCLSMATAILQAYNRAMLTKHEIVARLAKGTGTCEGDPARPTAET